MTDSAADPIGPVLVARFDSLIELKLALAMLESAGVMAMAADGTTLTSDISLLGSRGLALYVLDTDLEPALAELADSPARSKVVPAFRDRLPPPRTDAAVDLDDSDDDDDDHGDDDDYGRYDGR